MKKSVAVLITIFVISMGVIAIYAAANGKTQVDEKKTITANNINTIKLKTVNADIKLIPTNGNKILIHFHGVTSKSIQNTLETSTEQGILNIEVKRKKTVSSLSNEKLLLDISLPKSYHGDLTGITNSGDIKASDVNAKDLGCTTVAGNITLKNINALNTEAKSNAGDIHLDGIKSKIKAVNISGNIEAKFSILDNDLNFENNSGDTNIILPAASGFSLDYKTTAGDFSSELTLKKSNTIYLYGNSKTKITVKSITGDLKLIKKLS